MNYIPETQRELDTIQNLSLSCLQKFGFWYRKISKILVPCHILKRVLENGNPTARAVYAKYFCNMLVLYNSTAVFPSQFLIYLKFILPAHVHITYSMQKLSLAWHYVVIVMLRSTENKVVIIIISLISIFGENKLKRILAQLLGSTNFKNFWKLLR